MRTRNGIYYDLRKSEYRKKIDKVTFVFSSKLHKERFIERLEEHREYINKSLTKRFHFNIDVSMLADLVLYSKIETRGFLVIYEGVELCQNNIILNGVTMMSRSLKE